MTPKTKTYFEAEVDKIVKEHYLPAYHYVRVRQSRAFMEKYLSEQIEVEKIASVACMSRFHFIRIFKRAYGLSPRQYLRDLRMTKGKELLKQGLNVSEVCVEVGYDSLPTFSHAFKRATGYSPKAYQNLYNRNLE